MAKEILYKEDNEISELRNETNKTYRATVDSVEEVLYKPIPVLDHGFVRVVDYMGDDSAVVQSARVSYGKGTKMINQDRGLIHYLMRHRHTTPFEMCDIKLHIKLPIFIARQWIRHRTASVNEYSARYSILGKEFYIPNREHLAAQSQINRQGRDGLLSDERAAQVMDLLKNDAENCYSHYTDMLNEDEQGNVIDENKEGLTRELARMNLTLNYYTEWYWKINLHNLLHFLSLRADPHAQYEIRAYAEAILDIVKKWVPISYEAFEEYRLKGTSFSGNALEFIKARINGKKLSFEDLNMTKREWREIHQSLGLEDEL